MPRRAAALAGNVLLASLFAALAWAHVEEARRTGRWATALPIVGQEAILVALFLTRRRSLATSARPLDWVVGVAGAFLPLLLRPTDPEGRLSWLGQPVQVAALALAAAGTLGLGRSIGLVAANRGVQTAGLYRVVRHPMYVAYGVFYLGYVASYPSGWNGALVAVTLAAFVARAHAEERLLAAEPAYRDYLGRVRWRFIPYVH
jgi:protein-S-isoprenylcysteine O-methyltransferase Ste14